MNTEGGLWIDESVFSLEQLFEDNGSENGGGTELALMTRTLGDREHSD